MEGQNSDAFREVVAERDAVWTFVFQADELAESQHAGQHLILVANIDTADQIGIAYQLEKLTDIKQFASYGVMMTPALFERFRYAARVASMG